MLLHRTAYFAFNTAILRSYGCNCEWVLFHSCFACGELCFSRPSVPSNNIIDNLWRKLGDQLRDRSDGRTLTAHDHEMPWLCMQRHGMRSFCNVNLLSYEITSIVNSDKKSCCEFGSDIVFSGHNRA